LLPIFFAEVRKTKSLQSRCNNFQLWSEKGILKATTALKHSEKDERVGERERERERERRERER
jgi:hypothetical protein